MGSRELHADPATPRAAIHRAIWTLVITRSSVLITIHTDAGGAGLAGTVTFISPKAEFTPRNVQTAEERSKLVYRIKVSVDNAEGVLKPGMPVEADVPLSAVAPAAK